MASCVHDTPLARYTLTLVTSSSPLILMRICRYTPRQTRQSTAGYENLLLLFAPASSIRRNFPALSNSFTLGASRNLAVGQGRLPAPHFLHRRRRVFIRHAVLQGSGTGFCLQGRHPL